MRGFFAGVEVGDGDASSLACLAMAAAAVVAAVSLVSAGFSIVAFASSYDKASVEDFQTVGSAHAREAVETAHGLLSLELRRRFHLPRIGTTISP